MHNCILLRYGEIGLKSKRTRFAFEKKYVQAIEEALKRNGITNFNIQNFGGRFVIFSNQVENILPILNRISGIQSFSPAANSFFSSKEDLLKGIKKYGVSLVQGKTFAVRVKRIGKHEFNSKELEKEGGSVLYDEGKGIDLGKPEVTIFLEIRDNNYFIFTKTIKGMGGLPPLSSGKVLCLFSGGIDSPVAAYEMLKRGCQVDFVIINLVGDKSLANALQVYNYLINQYAFCYTPKIFVVDGKKLVENITKDVPDRIRQIALKIVFYQISEIIAKKEGYLAIATGESLSQKSSQTLPSLSIIESQVDIMVFRPLLSLDKTEITEMAAKIGTLAKSEKVKEYCRLSMGPVVTSPTENSLKKIPSFKELVGEAVKEMKITKGIAQVEEDLDLKLEQKYISIDVRPKNLQEMSKLKADKSMPYPFVLEHLEEFDKENSYLLICDYGVQSEEVAFLLRKKGIKASGVSLRNYLKYFLKT